MKLLLYCTKTNRYDKVLVNNKDQNCIFLNRSKAFNYDDWERFKYLQILNGKIVGECDFEVEEIKSFVEDEEYIDFEYGYYKYGYRTNKEDFDDLMQHSCLTAKQLDDYLKGKSGKAIHIKNLHIFDEPKELSDYYKILSSKEYDTKINKLGYRPKEWLNVPVTITKYFAIQSILEPLKNAPQNMIYVCEYDESTFFADYYKRNILISIHPEWLVKILNGEKTIEIRKKVLKEMQ